jgi:pimeloyl-ACP methyl ester carboxylesterase
MVGVLWLAGGGTLATTGRATALALPSRSLSLTSSQRDFAGLVNIGNGRKMYLECRGKGGPTVILESGYRGDATVWSLAEHTPAVLPGVARFTRVCAYDRPGTVGATPSGHLHLSRSTPVAMPRTARQVVSDLHRLLRAAHIAGPYVIVGHSAGGLIAQLYASTDPRAVAGLVLVDAFAAVMPKLMGPLWSAYRAQINTVPAALESYGHLEYLNFDASCQQVLHGRPLPRMPLVVVSKGRPFQLPAGGLPPGFAEALEREWSAGQEYLARLEPHAIHVVANAGHDIYAEDPGIVILSIRYVVDTVRRSRALGP